ncbi:hypothetical protein QN277_011690 [Acacia crassicarpa]|uniref:Expansin n=2 Tax=Acacia crassicarpa TaxID=499986 RepID=A0AAE1MZQ3_9FABA|nr:hypothetical protein QN277_011690 [Acacia crassicarpa]
MAVSASCFFWFQFMMAISFSVMASFAFDGDWHDAHATFYGDMSGGETMQGACAYGDLFKQGYGLETAALSTALFNNGATCGACFELECINDPQWCIPGAGTIKITATNFCPPNYDPPIEYRWCNPPREHFDLSMAMFTKIANYKAGIVPIHYRRVPCSKSGGVKFELKGNPYWITTVFFNVANAGDITDAKIRGGNGGDWIQMTRNWGQLWQTGTNLVGQSLSYMLTSSDGKTLEFDNVAPSNWQFGQTYEANYNF